MTQKPFNLNMGYSLNLQPWSNWHSQLHSQNIFFPLWLFRVSNPSNFILPFILLVRVSFYTSARYVTFWLRPVCYLKLMSFSSFLGQIFPFEGNVAIMQQYDVHNNKKVEEGTTSQGRQTTSLRQKRKEIFFGGFPCRSNLHVWIPKP